MYKISAKLVSKSLIKEGESEHGKWRLVEFMLQKQFKGEKFKIIFTAFGKNADFILQTKNGTRITVRFVIKCNKANNRWYTNLKATKCEIYKSKKDKVKEKIESEMKEKNNSILTTSLFFKKNSNEFDNETE